MKRSAFSVLCAALVLFSGHSANAQSISGNELQETCVSQDPVFGGFCIGYILGAIEGMSLGAYAVLGAAGEDETSEAINASISSFLGHCTPAEATNDQLRDVVVKYLHDNPETRHMSGRILILQAMQQAFPC